MDVNSAVPLNKPGIFMHFPFPCFAGGTNMFQWAPLRPGRAMPGGTLHLFGAPDLTEAVQGVPQAVKG